MLRSKISSESGVSGRVENGGGNCERMQKAKIPVKTFPIKKRINTELFIDGKIGLYIAKVKEGSDQ